MSPCCSISVQIPTISVIMLRIASAVLLSPAAAGAASGSVKKLLVSPRDGDRVSEEHSLKSEKKSESEASVPGEKTVEEEVLLLHNVSSEHLRINKKICKRAAEPLLSGH